MKKINIIILLLLLGIIFFISYLFTNKKILYFSLKGVESVEINIGEEYEEKGFKAEYCDKLKLFCKDVSDNVKINKKEVESNRYFLNYILNYKSVNKVLTREIIYVDKESPVIELITNNDITQCPNSKYFEEGYTAYDNVDGDLTSEVVKTIKDNKVYYSVSDSSGNKKVIYREINFIDKDAPKIILNGNEVQYIFINQEYNEQGVTIVDNCDTDLSDKIEIKNNIDNKTVGEYEVSYTVSDNADNKITKTRKVIVYNDISEVPKNGKVVYLTFDDGPGSYTEEILNILDKYNVKATFFVTNQFSSYHDLIKKEYVNGHTVAVHTYSHNYKDIYSSFDNYLNDFSNMNQIIFEQTGEYSKIFRFPGGSSNTISKFNKGIMTEIVNKMNELGYYYFDWNVDSMDTSEKDPELIFENVKTGLLKNDFSVVLMHDIKKANVESVEKIVSYGLNNGYTFLPLDENAPLVQHKVNN